MPRPRNRRSYAVPKGKGRHKNKNSYPIHDLPHARNAITRVEQFGSPEEKRLVRSAVRRRYPALAKRSKVIPTKTGTGRRYGQPKGASNRKGRSK